MAEPPYIRQIGARHLNSAVTVMAWNNKMDLMAYGTEKGKPKMLLIITSLKQNQICAYFMC